MGQALDPVTQNHINKAADALATRVRGRLLAGDDRPLHQRIDRSAGRRVDQRVRARPRAPVRARAAQGARPGRREIVTKEQPEVLFVCVHNAGRSQMAAGLVKLRSEGRIHVRSAGSAPADANQPCRRRRRMERARRRHERGVPEATHRRGRARRGRGDHDGLRRRLPDLPRQAVRGLGARRPRRAQDLEGSGAIRDEIDARVQKLVGELLA